jgi:adenylyltransferase/sulfurtransferase
MFGTRSTALGPESLTFPACDNNNVVLRHCAEFGCDKGGAQFPFAARGEWLFSHDMSNPAPLEISVTETKRLLDETPGDVMLIDVREPDEVATCCIAGTEHIPMRQIPNQLDRLPKDKHLLIHCHHGGRSMKVTQFLRANGYDAVSNVEGGIDAWSLVIDPTVARY